MRTLAGLPVEVGCFEEGTPEKVDAVAIEDDTYFVIGADPGFKEPTEHPIRIWTAAHEAEPAAPGSVQVRDGRPLRLHAVVHDLSEDPTWKEEWVGAALAGILREVEGRGLRSLALPMLGAVHGKLPLARFVDLLRAALYHSRPVDLESLVLLAPKGATQDLERLLHS
jgi:hypothetical protein